MKACGRAVLVALFLVATFALGPSRADSATVDGPPPPQLVHLTTRPALANATFSLDGVAYTTGADGTVTIPTSALNDLDQRLRFVSVVTGRLAKANFIRFETPPASGNSREAIAVFNIPVFVHLTTRPALANATFSLDGVPYTTGADGTVTIPTSALNHLDQRLKFVSVVTDPLTKADFDRIESPPASGNSREAIAVFNITRFLHLTTVPALANATFSLDGVPYTTGADGTVTIPTSTVINLDQRLKFVSVATDPLTKADFVRFATPPQAGYWRQAVAIFDVSHAVRFSFGDASGVPVPLDRVTSMTIRNSTGEERRLSPDDLAHPVMLPAVHPYSKGDHPEPQILRYTVQEIIVDGANTVTPSQHEFFPANVDDLHLGTSIFTVQVSVRDALFGFADASTVVVRHPDGTETRHSASGGKLTLEGLPRGDYVLRVEEAALNSSRPLSVSRDQTVEVATISKIDLGAVAGVIVILVGGLLVLGNRRRSRRRRRLGPPGEDPTGMGGRSPSTPEPGMPFEAPSREAEPVGVSADGRLGAPLRGWRIVAGAMVLAAALVATPGRLATPSVAAKPHVPALAYFYIWFDQTSWDRAKADLPVAGKYSSDDRAIMEQQVRSAKATGLDGFIVSWKSTPKLDRRLAQLADVAEEQNFKLVVIYEGLDFNRNPTPTDTIASDLDTFISRFAPRPAFHLFNKPMIILSGSWGYSPADIGSLGAGRRDKILLLGSEKAPSDVQRLRGLIDGDAYYWSSVNPATFPGYQDKLNAMAAEVHADGGLWIAPAASGFDATLLGKTTVVDRLGGQTLRTEFAAANSSQPDAIGVISWNEYSENSHIEPSHHYGDQSVQTLTHLLGGEAASPPPGVLDSSEPEGRGSGWSQAAALGSVAMLTLVAAAVLVRRHRRAAKEREQAAGLWKLIDSSWNSTDNSVGADRIP